MTSEVIDMLVGYGNGPDFPKYEMCEQPEEALLRFITALDHTVAPNIVTLLNCSGIRVM